MKIEKLNKIALTLICLILSIFIIKYLKIIPILKQILTISIPLFIGFIYAWLMNPLITKISKKIPRKITCILVFLSFIFLLLLTLYLIIPNIYKEISEVLQILPTTFEYLETKINNMGFTTYLEKIQNFLIETIPIYLLNIIRNTFKYIGTTSIGLILGLYISFDYPYQVKKINDIIPDKYKCLYTTLITESSDSVRKCIHGTLLIATFVFLGTTILFTLIKLDAPLIFGLVCGITDLIPYIGPYIGGIIAILVGYTKSNITGFLTLLICIIIQMIENYLLQPIIMSKSISLSPVLIITSLLIFGNLFGIIGMILAPSITAILKVLYTHLITAIKECP